MARQYTLQRPVATGPRIDFAAAGPLLANTKPQRCFNGQMIGHSGFLISSDERASWVARDLKVAEVTCPYLNDEDAWPDDYRFQILPGDAYETRVLTARESEISGKFSMRFRYTYSAEAVGAKRTSGIKYPDDLWVGSTISEPVEIEIPKRP